MKLSEPQRQVNDGSPTDQTAALKSVSALLAAFEEISRGRPDRVLRLRGHVAIDGQGVPVEGAGAGREPFELLIFRGFSSSVTHPTAFDPDRPALPEGAAIETAELLAGPLDPSREQRLAGPHTPEGFLSSAAW